LKGTNSIQLFFLEGKGGREGGRAKEENEEGRKGEEKKTLIFFTREWDNNQMNQLPFFDDRKVISEDRLKCLYFHLDHRRHASAALEDKTVRSTTQAIQSRRF
jgi:hypothetical protein